MNKAVALIVLISCSFHRGIYKEDEVNHFPVTTERPAALPSKENFYLFILAGQSNMAGRGFVQPADTVPSPKVLTLNKNNEWVYAKEPLHYYEPSRTGLDCGLAFGKKLTSLYKNDITIGLIPCAVGGTSIEQWLGDSVYRLVRLYSNLLKKAHTAASSGTLKGILWHQGEANAVPGYYSNYRDKLQKFFAKLRKDLNASDLPVYAGQLALFLHRSENPFADSVNNDLALLSLSMKNVYVINTLDLTPKSDSIHFNSPSQRMMGERFAEMVYRTTKF